jgi:hypothetical protein
MTMNWLLNDIIDTKVTVSVLEADGSLLTKKSFKNTLTKEGVTVLSRLILDPSAARPSHIYARFADDKTDADSNTQFATDVTYTNITYSDFVNSNDDSIGALREPIFTTVKVENNADISDGILTFYFRLTPNSTLGSADFTAGTSQVFYLGLAAASNQSDASQDLIFSVLTAYDNLNEGFTIPNGGQVTIDYKLTLGV